MKLDRFIKRPVLSTVISILVVILGVLGNIGFFFVPPGVAIMLYFDIIKAQLLPIVVASVVSTVLVLAVTGWVHQFYGKAKAKIKND